jgi:hypothetical protein
MKLWQNEIHCNEGSCVFENGLEQRMLLPDKSSLFSISSLQNYNPYIDSIKLFFRTSEVKFHTLNKM